MEGQARLSELLTRERPWPNGPNWEENDTMREWAKRKPDRWDTVSEISGFTMSEVALSGATASPSGGRHGASARSKDSERHLNRGQGTRKL